MRSRFEIRTTHATDFCGVCGKRFETNCKKRGDAGFRNDIKICAHLLVRHPKVFFLRDFSKHGGTKMNANRTVSALRTAVDVLDDGGGNFVVKALKGHMASAADLIESQQSQLAAKDAEIARLTAERTAVLKALQRSDIDCDSCKHNGIGDCEGTLEDTLSDCGNCAQDCPCKPCDGISKWEWRGAGED